MRISPLIKHLRRHCPSFKNYISGGIDWKNIKADAAEEYSDGTQLLAGYVILTDEQAEPSATQNVVRQDVTEEFDICVVFPQEEDGNLTTGDLVNSIRAELCLALVGLIPEPNYTEIQYAGRQLVHMNGFQAVYRFSFTTSSQLGRNGATECAETWQERTLDCLEPFEETGISE